jgi:hypothetical protein
VSQGARSSGRGHNFPARSGVLQARRAIGPRKCQSKSRPVLTAKVKGVRYGVKFNGPDKTCRRHLNGARERPGALLLPRSLPSAGRTCEVRKMGITQRHLSW